MGKTRKIKWPRNGEEWLRDLFEYRLYNFPEGAYCRQCGVFDSSRRRRCVRCGEETNPIDWEKVSNSIKRTLQRDRTKLGRSLLLEKTVADYQNRYPPEDRKAISLPILPGPLSWLNDAIQRMQRPPGRPFDLYEIYKKVVPDQKGELPAMDDRERKRVKAFLRDYRTNPDVRIQRKTVRNKKSVKKSTTKPQ